MPSKKYFVPSSFYKRGSNHPKPDQNLTFPTLKFVNIDSRNYFQMLDGIPCHESDDVTTSQDFVA